MRKTVKEYDFDLDGRMVRVLIFKEGSRFWGRWDSEDKGDAVSGWCETIPQTMSHVECDARKSLQKKEPLQ